MESNSGQTYLTENDVVFFYGGFMSQWFPCRFKIDGVEYNCAEQYMMYKKAALFADADAMMAIMESESPAKQKAIGREVKNFCPATWSKVSRDVVFSANMAKFTSDERLGFMLKQTGDKLLVEASPTDKIWGIGLSEYSKDRFDMSLWRGENWLGKVLMRVRSCLMWQNSMTTDSRTK